MFTGIIEETGKILTIEKNSITIECNSVLEDSKIGDSIAVNGVCLTIVELKDNYFKADISPETYKVTALGKLFVGSLVNLERAMPSNGRFGGHIVSGHTDGLGKVISIKQNNEFYDLEIELSENESKYVVKKGSITINGISLTIADIKSSRVKLAIIPHTFEFTNLCKLKSGDFVNIEVDIISKYVEKFLSTGDNRSGVNMDFLRENGFC